MLERYVGDPNIDWDEDLFLDAKEVGDYGGGFEVAACAELFDDPSQIALEDWPLDEAELAEVASQAESKAEIERIYALNGEDRDGEGSKDSYRGLPHNSYTKADKTLAADNVQPDRNAQLLSHLGLVYNIALKRGPEESLKRSDFFQVGFMGLMRAAETYDSSKGKFPVHAFIGIRSAIGREIGNHEKTIRLHGDHNIYGRFQKIDWFVHKATRYSKQMPFEAAELYKAALDPDTNFTLAETEEYINTPVARLGLDEIDEPTVEEPGYAEVEDLLILDQFKHDMTTVKHISILKSRVIFLLVSGIFGPKLTNNEIGQVFGITTQGANFHYQKGRQAAKYLLPTIGIEKPAS
jgi:RNA polymerase sigma factor (sigma-70 family)